MDVDNIKHNFFKLKQGEKMTYFNGYLALERARLDSDTEEMKEVKDEISALGSFFFTMEENGHCFLLQDRNGEDDYTYIAVKK